MPSMPDWLFRGHRALLSLFERAMYRWLPGFGSLWYLWVQDIERMRAGGLLRRQLRFLPHDRNVRQMPGKFLLEGWRLHPLQILRVQPWKLLPFNCLWHHCHTISQRVSGVWTIQLPGQPVL